MEQFASYREVFRALVSTFAIVSLLPLYSREMDESQFQAAYIAMIVYMLGKLCDYAELPNNLNSYVYKFQPVLCIGAIIFVGVSTTLSWCAYNININVHSAFMFILLFICIIPVFLEFVDLAMVLNKRKHLAEYIKSKQK